MPAGKPWLLAPAALRGLPTEAVYWHIYHQDYPPLAANPYSQARLALVDPGGARKSEFGMFYFANDLAGALWEVILRYVEPDAARGVRVEPSRLAGMRVVRLRLRNSQVTQLDLGQPGLRMLFLPDSAESVAVAALLADPDHRNTHTEARELREQLVQCGTHHMPVLAWPSRQHSASTVYLAFDPPMTADWWELIDEPQSLDTLAGHAIIRDELARCGFEWVLDETDATPPEDPA